MNWVLDEYKQGRRNFDGVDLSGLKLDHMDISDTSWKHADLSDCDLRSIAGDGCDFSGARFNDATLKDCDFRDSTFKRASFHKARLVDPIFARTSLHGVDLCGAEIVRGQFGWCLFNHANLTESMWKRPTIFDSTFRFVSLTRTLFIRAERVLRCDFRGSHVVEFQTPRTVLDDCKLTGTCFDQTQPLNLPKPGVFDELEPGWLIGYRPETSMFVSRYVPGQLRNAQYLSTSYEASHPGIYVNPTIDDALHWRMSQPYHPAKHRLVSVIFRPWECHVADGPAYRVRWCIVWDYV